MPPRYAGCRFVTWDPELYGSMHPRQQARDYLATWPPQKPVLVLSGDKGTGKTHLAVSVLWDALERFNVAGKLWNTIDLLDRYKRTFDQDRATETEFDINEELARCPLLVLDDFGVQQDTEWSRALTYQVINRRYNEGKPLVVTTNLANIREERSLDRISDTASSIMVAFSGASVRRMER